MPRPIITRTVYSLPPYNSYGPIDKRGVEPNEIINMTIEEYETIRLIDELDHTQAECAELMGIGRTTAQRIYNNARKKVALSLVHGRIILFEGGNYCFKGRGKGHGKGNMQRGRGMGRNRNK